MDLVVGIVALVVVAVAMVVYKHENVMMNPLVVGLRLLAGGKTPVCRTLAGLADQYGRPLFTFRFGFHRIHVVSTWEALKECFTTNDKFLASRPASALGKYIGQNYAIFGLGPDGPYWREMRKLVMVELLSSKKLSDLSHIRVFEVATFIQKLHISALSNKPILLNHFFSRLMMNIISTMVATKRYSYCDDVEEDDKEAIKAHKTIRDLMYAAGQFVLSDAIPLPFLERLDLQGHIKMMKRVSKDSDLLIGGWINQHRQQRLMQHHKLSHHQDFIDTMLSLVEQGEIKSDYFTSDTKINALVKIMFLGATDSTSVTLTWLGALLVNHPHVLRRATLELDRVVGRDRWVTDSDINDLVYIQAIVKETLRLYPTAPLLVPHAATEDCYVAGQVIKKGEQVLVNVWKVHRDPRIWKDPHEFNPNRFLEIEIDVTQGRDFWFAPFGSGRRSCPGSELALQVMHLTVANLVQGFDLSTPTGEPADMTEGLGITMPKARPLEVKLKPRLSTQMYASLPSTT